VRAIILAAGQGTRLLPFTRDYPKCLVPVDGKAILDHQIDALRAAGIADILIVGGYRIDRLEQHIAAMPAAMRPALLCNPFWSVANSIGSVWAARGALDEPFCLLNGDTILASDVIAGAWASARAGVGLVVEAAPELALDDMRVTVHEGRITAVGKDLGEEARHRSLGVIVASGGGERVYAEALTAVICATGGAQRFHHAVIDHIARAGTVAALVNSNPQWIEIDRPEDIARWQGR